MISDIKTLSNESTALSTDWAENCTSTEPQYVSTTDYAVLLNLSIACFIGMFALFLCVFHSYRATMERRKIVTGHPAVFLTRINVEAREPQPMPRGILKTNKIPGLSHANSDKTPPRCVTFDIIEDN
ncbi:hypothetical protein VCUG_00301 [Vavraia culicis subsp. floridensis]|uniref:Uncharacterized protein n=1 Tax=Vavraia culicis (isolate floridensis) TaxID=948595 RepID=L2GYT4_VAVCU|nr:uncharacterized protein VCUG_00301 [Vavraia culicis subsp. floridensis]ELA48260.1 hypothetical protein VCUG_00301 [Vavraia culicis subsp. floridensis]